MQTAPWLRSNCKIPRFLFVNPPHQRGYGRKALHHCHSTSQVVRTKRVRDEGVVCAAITATRIEDVFQHVANHRSWDDIYDRELQNHQDGEDDEGMVWFSESNAEEAVLMQLDELEEEGFLRRSGNANDAIDSSSGIEGNEYLREARSSRFLDLGTGNGHMLLVLRDQDEDDQRWSGEMVGVDYSETSVCLARRITAQRYARDDAATRQLRFERWDLLSSPPGDWQQDGFDVVLDKGTFDAISLMQPESGSQHPCDTYRTKVTPLVKPLFFLFVTSCNWTRDELIGWLAPDDGELTFYSEVKYPTFTFGGQTGQSIVTIIFQRKDS